MPTSFSKKLLTWYKKHGRHDLPWQKNPTAYRVWISEIMLQQTQVNTVIPYYFRFLKSFPTVKSLANATEDFVLLHWSGLGYYARARNIHKTAKIIHEQYGGQFPSTVAELSELPGIGQSTAGAIVSFSRQKKAVILDGNVKRVLARYFAIEKPINQLTTMTELWTLAHQLTPEKNAHHYNQAIMDLGATLCTRHNPDCRDCPFQSDCQAYKNKKTFFYPVKIEKKSRVIKTISLFVISNKQKEILLVKRPSEGIWGGLWSFPEKHSSDFIFRNQKLHFIAALPSITHQLTHFTLIILPLRLSISKKISGKDLSWYTLGAELPGGVATPIAKLLKSFVD